MMTTMRGMSSAPIVTTTMTTMTTMTRRRHSGRRF
jgi:hypothetical protein